jgi:hypothetical protein
VDAFRIAELFSERCLRGHVGNGRIEIHHALFDQCGDVLNSLFRIGRSARVGLREKEKDSRRSKNPEYG